MFGKSSTTRWDDTVAYLNLKFPCAGLQDRLGAHIEKVVPAGLRAGISKELSIGYRHDGEDDPTYAATTDKRKALRGLFLCQRVYYSRLWAARGTFAGDKVEAEDKLPLDWRTQSMQYWGGKSEHDILQGIAMFAPVPGAVATDLCRVAQAGPPNGKGSMHFNLKLSRADVDLIGPAETCYNGVTAWLVGSGLASMRWFMMDTAPNNQFCCERIFGAGVEVWNSGTPFKPTSQVPQIPIGHIVHIWNINNYNWNGHWVVSNGDGTVCGVNNGDVNTPNEVVLKKYTKTATLKNQFLGYGGRQCKEVMNDRGFLDLVEVDPAVWRKAVMVEVDPTVVEAQIY